MSNMASTSPDRERVLTIQEAAAFCGYATTAGLRKAVFGGRLRALDRRGAGGPTVFELAELERFQRFRFSPGRLAPVHQSHGS